MQSRPDTPAVCAHCAYSGPMAGFHAFTRPLHQPIEIVRRVPRVSESQHAPAGIPPQPHWQHPQYQAAAQPTAPMSVAEALFHAAPRVMSEAPAAYHPQPGPPQPQQQHAIARMTPTNSPGMSAAPESRPAPIDEAIAPMKKKTWPLWLAVSVFFVLAGAVTGMLGWEQFQLHLRKLGKLRQTRSSTAPIAAAQATTVAAAREAAMRDAVESRVAVVEAITVGEPVIKRFFESKTLEERLRFVAEPESHRAEVAAMFDGGAKQPALVKARPLNTPPLSLTTHEMMPVFMAVTSTNPMGGLVWIVSGADQKPVIHWPLFHQTHEKRMAEFVADQQAEPQWFHVGVRVTHPFELPESARTEYISFDIDGSTDASGRVHAYASKNSPVGRLLERQVDWGKLYFGKVLVGWMDIAGEKRLAILDCEGAEALGVEAR